MAEKNTSITYGAIMKKLMAGEFAPIYILMGDESYYIDKISDYIAENVLKPEERDFNQSIVFGADTTAAAVADLCKGYPMMAERRVVILKEAQNLRNFDALEKYFEKPVKSTVFVMCYKNGSIDKRKKLLSRAEAAGVVFESKKLFERQLPGFIETYLKTQGATIEPKATMMIADAIGADLHRLTSELDKVLISLPDNNKRVTPDIVEREIGVSKEFNAFELRSALVNRNAYKANQIINYFDNNPKSGSLYALLPTLFSYFQNLMIAFYAPARGDENELAKFLEIRNAWAAHEYTIGMKNFPARKVVAIIDKIKEIDAKSKGLNNPNTSAGELMKELIFFILH